MPKLKVTQVRGSAGKPRRQRDTLRALGLRRIRQAVVKEDRPEIRGMIARIEHLVVVEDVEE